MTDKNHQSRDLRYAIIGAGMAGLLAAIKLKEKGQTDFVVYEKADAMGGTWRENRYPGLTCDVPAHAYTYSFAPYAEWNAYHATGAEIKRYFETVAQDYDIEPFIQFNTEVKHCQFDEAAHQWHISLSDGRQDCVDVIICASGVLHHPKMPDIKGLGDFQGACFHSAQWDENVALDNQRIGLIGSGSSGIQIATALSSRAAQLVHFQRSPQWIMPVQQFPYSEEEKQAFRDDVEKINAIRYDETYWHNVYRFNKGIIEPDSPEMKEIEAYCLNYLETSVTDPVLREKLRPNYRAACKRLVYSWQYYDTVQRPNVLIETSAIDKIEANGVRMANGHLHELDILVLATGFQADQFIRPTQVIGREQKSLDTAWAERASAYYAISVPSFPNFFMLNGPTGPVGNFSLIDIAEMQWGYIEQLLKQLQTGAAASLEPTQEAFEAYEEKRIKAAQKTIFNSGCTSWYLDKTGIPMTWPWSYQAFVDAMKKPDMNAFIEFPH
ncbi:MAG: flavin-containing monooxygenase [Parvibaculales bacterium]